MNSLLNEYLKRGKGKIEESKIKKKDKLSQYMKIKPTKSKYRNF